MIDYGYNQSELCWGTAGPITDAEVRHVLQTIKDLGGSRVRMAVQLGTVAELDRAVTLSREYGLKPLLCLVNNPAFGYAATVASFATMCTTIATRYGPSGTGALKNSCTEIELGNESNISPNPPQVADGAGFAKFLKAGYTAIKAVHPSCKVFPGGTIPTVTIPNGFILTPLPPFIIFGSASDPVKWYTDLYAAGCKNFMDALAIHLYADILPSPTMRQWKYLTDVRDVMVANGDAAKQIWVTEVGVGYPAPGVTSLLQARDWLKVMVEGIESYSYTGPFFVFNARNYSGGDGTGLSYGMVDVNFAPRQPMYDYAKTIAGTPADPLDIVPPSSPTGLMYSDVTSNSATFTWNPNPAIDGATNYRLKTLGGAQLADTRNTTCQINGLPSGTPQSFRVFAVDAAGNESLTGSNTVAFTTNAPAGGQSDFTLQFSGSDVPTALAQLGLGYAVAGGVATPNAPTVDGKYVTVAPCDRDAQSPDHSSRVSLAGVAGGSDRTALAIVRMSPDGTQWIAAASPGGGNADSLVILMCVAGKLTVLKAKNTTPAGAGNDLLTKATGNVYTAQIITPGATVAAELKFTDINGVFPGATNLRPGLGWRHTRSKGINYPPPGITKWAATDVGPILPDGGFDLWMLGAIDDEEDFGLVISTGLWEAAL